MESARKATVLLLALLAAAGGGCRKKGRGESVNVVGSTSIQPFAEMLAQEYQKKHPQADVEVQGGGSTAGIQALADGFAAIGMCSRNLSEKEAKLYTPIPIARDGLAVVVHPSNPVENLSLAQLREVFAGRVRNWKELGGADRSIHLIMREEGSGTRDAFVHLVMKDADPSASALVQESNGAVRELVRSDRGAIGYMSLGLVGPELKALAVDGVPARRENVLAGRYILVRPFLFVTRGDVSPKARAFIDYVLSPEGQRRLEEEGLVRVR